jgi:hypothetical protein
VAQAQEGVIARRQVLRLGGTHDQIHHQLTRGHWQHMLPGVYATFTGAISVRARIWAAILFAGPGAVASRRAALWLYGAIDRAPDVIDVCIPWSRRVRGRVGIRIHRCRGQDAHPSVSPPRVRLETAVLDVADSATTPEQALDPVLRVTQRRLTTASRLRAALAARGRHRWRALLREVLAEVEDGVASALERRYALDVERAHGLPRGVRNTAERDPLTGQRRYRDVRYDRSGLVIELDGREAHPLEEAFRDTRRDNAVALLSDVVLRYGWRDVAGNPCGVAAEVAAVLAAHGWEGSVRPCRADCPSAITQHWGNSVGLQPDLLSPVTSDPPAQRAAATSARGRGGGSGGRRPP